MDREVVGGREIDSDRSQRRTSRRSGFFGRRGRRFGEERGQILVGEIEISRTNSIRPGESLFPLPSASYLKAEHILAMQGFILSPTPHLSSPTSLILPQLSTKLHILRLNLLSSLRSTTSLVSAERERGLEALELEIEAREQAIEEKEIREREVEEMKRVLVESQVLLQEFTEARGGGGKPRASRAIGRDDSGYLKFLLLSNR